MLFFEQRARPPEVGTISDEAQVGTEGYDAIVTIMDLLSMHGDEVLTPLNVTTHDFLVLLKEAAGTTIIPSPTVEHSLSEVLHKINGTSPLEDRGQEDGSSTTANAARAAAAAAAITVNEQLTAAKSAVAQATSHLELMREIVNQARVIAHEATLIRMAAHETLAAARRKRAAAIDPIDVAAADESQCVAELHAAGMDTAAAAKSQLATGAQALFESATHTHADAVHALNALRERTTNANAPDDAEGSVRTSGTIATPRSMSSLSTTPTVAMVTATVTPGLILPRNDFRRAPSWDRGIRRHLHRHGLTIHAWRRGAHPSQRHHPRFPCTTQGSRGNDDHPLPHRRALSIGGAP